MLSAEENAVVTRVGPGTPMGQLLRRYWMPAALSDELNEPDGVPLRVKLLGERLVAFRDTQGRVGLVGEGCPHRGASLWLGRNEESGLRCVYHGWKFDVSGACVDMPCETSETDFKAKVRVKAYPTVEMGDVVWAYMGPVEKMPPPPKFEFGRSQRATATRRRSGRNATGCRLWRVESTARTPRFFIALLDRQPWAPAMPPTATARAQERPGSSFA